MMTCPKINYNVLDCPDESDLFAMTVAVFLII
jgi:hypothetical protein